MINLEEVCQKWNLTDLKTLPKRSYSAIYSATQAADNRSVILKFGLITKTVAQEAKALEIFNGDGAVKLYHVDESQYALLPGSTSQPFLMNIFKLAEKSIKNVLKSPLFPIKGLL
jgi:hypothetical protein